MPALLIDEGDTPQARIYRLESEISTIRYFKPAFR